MFLLRASEATEANPVTGECLVFYAVYLAGAACSGRASASGGSIRLITTIFC